LPGLILVGRCQEVSGGVGGFIQLDLVNGVP